MRHTAETGHSTFQIPSELVDATRHRKHCQHCKGRRGPCACKSGCPRIRESECFNQALMISDGTDRGRPETPTSRSSP
eukprot:5173906-Amphidinium_carterae.1